MAGEVPTQVAFELLEVVLTEILVTERFDPII